MSAESGASGALEGAAGGAMVGSVIPGVGTAIGAGLGGLLGGLDGLFGSGSQKDQDRQSLQDYIDQLRGLKAPQAGPVRFADPSQYEGMRQGYLNQLQQWMQGNGPSAALAALKSGLGQNIANNETMAASASARGGGANAYRNAAQLSALQGSTMTQQAAVERAQEQQAAAQMYGTALDQGIGQTQQLSEFNSEQANQANLANLSSMLTTLGITTQGQLQALLARLGSEPSAVGDQLLAGGATAFSNLGKLGAQGGGTVQSGGTPGTPNDGFYHGPRT